MTANSIRYLRSHRVLLWRTSLADVRTRYAGSILGLAWLVLAPGLLLGLYAMIYIVVFQMKLPGLSTTEYVYFIFAGLVPFLMTSESLSLGVGSVVTNKAVLENTVFPIDLAPARAVLSGQSAMIAGLPVVLIGTLTVDRLTWCSLAVLPLWALHVMALMGLSWILSLLNVVFRDVTNVIGVVLMALLIASPFAYTPDSVPPGVQPLLLLNPLAYYVRAYQDVLIFGHLPDTTVTVFVLVFSIGLFVGGGWFFERAKRVIIDYV